jgi:hypothetical protein
VIWSGTAASAIDLNPSGAASSGVIATTGLQQAGRAVVAGGQHAGIWSGSAASFIDLHPSGATASSAMATIGDFQAGFADFVDSRHAALWSGSAATFLDLHSSLNGAYDESTALSIWREGSDLKIGGFAQDSANNYHPILWTISTIPEPNSVSLVALGIVTFVLSRWKPSKR